MIGGERYHVLDCHGDGERISAHATEGAEMRHIMRQFEGHKRAFHGASSNMLIELPNPLHNLSIDEIIDEGELTITK